MSLAVRKAKEEKGKEKSENGRMVSSLHGEPAFALQLNRTAGLIISNGDPLWMGVEPEVGIAPGVIAL